MMREQYRCQNCGHFLYEHSVQMPPLRKMSWKPQWGCSNLGCECTEYKGEGVGLAAEQLALDPFSGVLQREMEMIEEMRKMREQQFEERIKPRGML